MASRSAAERAGLRGLRARNADRGCDRRGRDALRAGAGRAGGAADRSSRRRREDPRRGGQLRWPGCARPRGATSRQRWCAASAMAFELRDDLARGADPRRGRARSRRGRGCADRRASIVAVRAEPRPDDGPSWPSRLAPLRAAVHARRGSCSLRAPPLQPARAEREARACGLHLSHAAGVAGAGRSGAWRGADPDDAVARACSAEAEEAESAGLGLLHPGGGRSAAGAARRPSGPRKMMRAAISNT